MRRASPATTRGSPRAIDNGVGRARTTTTSTPTSQPTGTRYLDGIGWLLRGRGEPPLGGGEDLLHRDLGHDPGVACAPATVAGGAGRRAPDDHVVGVEGPVAGGVGGPEQRHHRRPRPRRRDGGARCPRRRPGGPDAPAPRRSRRVVGNERTAAPSEAATTRSASSSSPGPQVTTDRRPRDAAAPGPAPRSAPAGQSLLAQPPAGLRIAKSPTPSSLRPPSTRAATSSEYGSGNSRRPVASMPRGPRRARFLSITCSPARGKLGPLADQQRGGRAPGARRGRSRPPAARPTRRAQAADFHSPWKSRATS